MTTQKLYLRIATLVNAIKNCERDGNAEWAEKHGERLAALKEFLPSGSGFDNGTQIDFDQTIPEKLVLETSFHHMDEHGGYDGWTDHRIIVTASLLFGFKIRITGRDKRQIKDYIHDAFHDALSREVEQ